MVKVSDAREPNVNTPDAYTLVLRWLTGRSYSEAELRKRLHRKECAEDDIEQALQRCLELGYVDDRRYAQELVARFMRRGDAVGIRLRQELKKKGLSADLAEEVIAEESQQYDEEQLLAQVVQRRYANIDFSAIDQRQQRRIVNYLYRRGFSLAMILHQLNGNNTR